VSVPVAGAQRAAEQEIVCQDPIHVADEYLEQSELGWSQMDVLARPGYAPSEEVNFELADSRYYDSSERKGMDPDPARHIQKNEHWMLREP